MMSLFAHLWNPLIPHQGSSGGAQFVAITDPGTGLKRLAQEGRILRTFTKSTRTPAGATLSPFISASFLQHCWDSTLKTPELSARDARSVSAPPTKGTTRCSTGV